MSMPSLTEARTALFYYTGDRERQRDHHLNRCDGCDYCEGTDMGQEIDDENSISEVAIVMMCRLVLDKGWGKTLERVEHIGLTNGQATILCQVTNRLIGHAVLPDSHYN